MKQKTVVLGITASVAIYKACDLIRRLREKNFTVQVVLTDEAEKLISPLLLQVLSGNRVARGMFNEPEEWEVEHVSLAEKADLLLIAPATANIIGKLANGICDDLLTCVSCATRAPVVLCPAMNENMYTNKIVQGNIKKLKALGYRFIDPRKGQLACGKVGVGCLAEIDTILREVAHCMYK